MLDQEQPKMTGFNDDITMRTIVDLPDPERAQLDALCRQRGLSRAEAMRQASGERGAAAVVAGRVERTLMLLLDTPHGEDLRAQWLRRFLRFHGMRHSREMGSAEMNAFSRTWR